LNHPCDITADTDTHPHQFDHIAVPLINNRPWWLLVHKQLADEYPVLLPSRITVSLDCLKGHCNYDEILSEFLLVPAQELNPQQPFFSSSYQHAKATVDLCDDGKSYYLSQNYVWFLKKLQPGMFAWVDVLCIAPAGHTLQQAFGYMGDLYRQSVVIADYLQHPMHWVAAETRGWIYQESAFTALSHISMDKEAWSSPLGMYS
jgi:hypothetical protein